VCTTYVQSAYTGLLLWLKVDLCLETWYVASLYKLPYYTHYVLYHRYTKIVNNNKTVLIQAYFIHRIYVCKYNIIHSIYTYITYMRYIHTYIHYKHTYMHAYITIHTYITYTHTLHTYIHT